MKLLSYISSRARGKTVKKLQYKIDGKLVNQRKLEMRGGTEDNRDYMLDIDEEFREK